MAAAAASEATAATAAAWAATAAAAALVAAALAAGSSRKRLSGKRKGQKTTKQRGVAALLRPARPSRLAPLHGTHVGGPSGPRRALRSISDDVAF